VTGISFAPLVGGAGFAVLVGSKVGRIALDGGISAGGRAAATRREEW
jgi:hypothetical protein